ncbi:MAG TPA: hydroxymethylpyrimidine/phosphomethylpyrimidine kinase [Steroidobacteraceae bacterium]|jgi:hydroxymethylpyrimidine/phosphomethylpyrimidine kinase|nr:hydroxymethylpyrimidine/phosphomethylpyrimidine kinase [Steroidobacteraceae bacterium]
MSARPAVLVIAASDSSGGAGLTRDAQTLGELQVALRCAVTAVTVQTDAQLRAIHPVPPQIVQAQIRAALDRGVAAIKIGMLGTAATVRAVAESLPPREQVPIVLDPVLASSSGGTLLDLEGVQLLRTLLLPRVSVLTPNIPEAAMLLGEIPAAGGRIDTASLHMQLQHLLALGPAAVLIKGGHRAGGDEIIDMLGLPGRPPLPIASPRVPAQRRGTGCSLSSALAALLAQGRTLPDACSGAQRYVAESLRRSAELQIGRTAQPD